MSENKKKTLFEKFTPMTTNSLVQIELDYTLINAPIGDGDADGNVKVLCSGVGFMEVSENIHAVAFVNPVNGMLVHTLHNDQLYEILNVLDISNYFSPQQ